MTYAHDAHCNTMHTAGPEPCPPPRDYVRGSFELRLDAALKGFAAGVLTLPEARELVGSPEVAAWYERRKS